MKNVHLSGKLPLLMMAATVPFFSACALSRPDSPASATSGMSFFVTIANSGKGADQSCQKLATMARGGRYLAAYLSNSAVSGAPAVSAPPALTVPG